MTMNARWADTTVLHRTNAVTQWDHSDVKNRNPQPQRPPPQQRLQQLNGRMFTHSTLHSRHTHNQSAIDTMFGFTQQHPLHPLQDSMNLIDDMDHATRASREAIKALALVRSLVYTQCSSK